MRLYTVHLKESRRSWWGHKSRRFAKAALAFTTSPPGVTGLPRYVILSTSSNSSPKRASAGTGSCRSTGGILHSEGAKHIPRLNISITIESKALWIVCTSLLCKAVSQGYSKSEILSSGRSSTLSSKRPDKAFCRTASSAKLNWDRAIVYLSRNLL